MPVDIVDLSNSRPADYHDPKLPAEKIWTIPHGPLFESGPTYPGPDQGEGRHRRDR